MQVSKNVSMSPKNFGTGNTPAKLEKAANLVLKLAAAAIVIGGTLAAPPLSLAIGGQIVMYAGVAGTMFKSISKLFGVTTTE